MARAGEAVESDGSDVWVQMQEDGKTHFWNRRTHQTIWKPPEGIKVVWVGHAELRGRGP